MSLQVWLPLNGDLNNYGLDGNATITGSPSYHTAGKIGKGMNTAGATVSGTSLALNGVKQFSLAFWIIAYEDATSTNTWNQCFQVGTKTSAGASGSNFRFESCYGSSIRACSFHNNATYSITQSSRIIVQNKEEWHHVCVTCDGTNLYSYRDGVKIYTDAALGGSLTGTFIIGTTNRYLGCINDVRIYDHCLSAKEIKEISKGLVLHYPLDNNGLGNPNLVVNSQKLDDKFSTVTSAWTRSYTQEDSREEIWTATCTTAGSGGVHTAVFPKTTDKIGKQYTWSCWIKANRNISLTIGSESGGTKVKAVTTEWQYLTHTWTFTDATYQSFVWYSNSASWAVGDWFKVKDLKIEEGPNATPWCPNSADSLYSSWGMDETIEKDCSGYKNHGTKAGTFLYSSSSPRGNMSTIFSGAQSIAAGRTAMVTDAITVSWWGYMSNWANYTRAISCTESGGWNFEPNNGKISFPLYRNGGYLIVVDTKALSEYTAGWHHFAATYDGYKSCLYVDGVKKVTSAVSDVKYPITYNSSNGIFVGAEAGGSTTSPAGSYFNGYISDVRIYSTAFSENDIKELYQIPISIDKAGNSFAIEYNEKISPNFHKTGIIENTHIHENEADDSDSLSTFHIGKTKTFANQIYEV